MNNVPQELKRSHNTLGTMNRFTRALLRAELAADEGDVQLETFTNLIIKSAFRWFSSILQLRVYLV